VSVILIFIPVLFYIIKFRTYNFSDSPADWALLGNYIGGILGPIISLLSLIVLGYITFLISKNSNIENKNLFVFQRKVEAYEEFVKFLPSFNIIPNRLNQLVGNKYKELMLRKIESIDMQSQDMQEVYKLINYYSEFHYFLSNFKVRYSHLFDYNFNSEDYLKLVETSGIIKEIFNEFYKNMLDDRLELKIEIEEPFKNLSKFLVNFINGLREEL
ncbi:MAG TPA: hypothetical protein P5132_10960, partial [Bacteroidales bacterium]|nr:hypothetical protein [Bacteroidales bacterium]